MVNESIANWYGERYPGLRPTIIRNIPLTDDTGQPADVRGLLSIPAGKQFIFIHVGHLAGGVNIRPILEAFSSPAVDVPPNFSWLRSLQGYGSRLLHEVLEHFTGSRPFPTRSSCPPYAAGCDVRTLPDRAQLPFGTNCLYRIRHSNIYMRAYPSSRFPGGKTSPGTRIPQVVRP